MKIWTNSLRTSLGHGSSVYHPLLEVCKTHDRVLCLTNGANTSEIAEHMAMLHLHRKQDGVIFVEGEVHRDLLEQVTVLTPTITTSNCPVFMPYEYSRDIWLRLDTNIVFFKEWEADKYKLVDMFAVKGGPPISLNVGIWTHRGGITFQNKRNRWDRRNDLNGATLINSLDVEDELIKNDTGHIVGSTGFFQEKLFYITDGLNMKIETKKMPAEPLTRLKNGTWTGAIGVLQRKETDVCSLAIGVLLERLPALDYSIPTNPGIVTLIAAKPSGTNINMWVYLEVFGICQWIIFFVLLLVFVMLMTTFYEIHSQSSHATNALNAIETAYLFTIQLGSHSNINRLGPRFLTLTASMLTLLMFVYYTTDITSKMTSGQSEIPIWSFEDVIRYDYKVIVTTAYYKGLLAAAEQGTPKNIVYMKYVKNGRIRETEESLIEIISDPKTLLYHENIAMLGYPQAQNVIALKMDDSVYSYGAFGLPKNSEFLQTFNHYLLKEFEHGIINRLRRKYYVDLYVHKQFGMSEPQPLGYENVIFTFACLAIGMVASMVIATVEYIAMKMGQK